MQTYIYDKLLDKNNYTILTSLSIVRILLYIVNPKSQTAKNHVISKYFIHYCTRSIFSDSLESFDTTF